MLGKPKGKGMCAGTRDDVEGTQIFFRKFLRGSGGADVFCANVDLLTNLEVWCRFPSAVHGTLVMNLSFCHLFT